MTYLNVSSTEVERTTGRDANGDEILEAVSGGGGGGWKRRSASATNIMHTNCKLNCNRNEIYYQQFNWDFTVSFFALLSVSPSWPPPPRSLLGFFNFQIIKTRYKHAKWEHIMIPSSVTLPSAPIIIIKNCRNWVLEKCANNFLFRDTLTHTLKVPFLVPRPTRRDNSFRWIKPEI